MKYIIYMDVFFVVNLIMDFIILKAAAHYIKPQTTFVRCLAGGAVGSLLACLSLLLSYENMMVHMLFSYIFTVAAMVFATYGRCSPKQMIKRSLWLYFVTVFMGGAMNLLYDYTYFGYILRGIFEAVYENPVNLIKLCLFSGISYVVLQWFYGLLSRRTHVDGFVTVKLATNGKQVKVNGLIDSGNSLFDPYYGKPVHIVEYEAVQGILEGVDMHKEKYRLVPFHSLGKKNGLIEVLDFDELVVYADDDEESGIKYTEKKPAVGIYKATLSGENKYQMLLNSTVGGLNGNKGFSEQRFKL